MSQDGLPPPPPACLLRRNPSTQKGGTLVVDDVADLEAHRRRLCDPDGYRPCTCPRCARATLHVHDYRERRLREEPDPAAPAAVTVVRYRCIGCRAVWRILPLFLARLLWRSWPVVEAATLGPAPAPAAPQVPLRTVQRWRARLATAALLLVELLRDAGRVVLGEVAAHATREQLVVAYATAYTLPPGRRLARLAAVIHRLAPGVRLM